MGRAGTGGDVTTTCCTCLAPDPPVIFKDMLRPGVGGESESERDRSWVHSRSLLGLDIVLLSSNAQALLPTSIYCPSFYILPFGALSLLAFTPSKLLAFDQFWIIAFPIASVATTCVTVAPSLGSPSNLVKYIFVQARGPRGSSTWDVPASSGCHRGRGVHSS